MKSFIAITSLISAIGVGLTSIVLLVITVPWTLGLALAYGLYRIWKANTEFINIWDRPPTK